MKLILDSLFSSLRRTLLNLSSFCAFVTLSFCACQKFMRYFNYFVLALFGLILLIACSGTLQKDGIYEISLEKAKITLELPCQDEETKEFSSFINNLYQSADEKNKVLQFKDLAIGKLIIENKTDLYLKEGFTPAKATLHLTDGSAIEGIRIEKILSTVEFEAQSMGKSWKLIYNQGKNQYTHKLMDENWTLKIADDGSVATELMKLREEFAKLSTDILPSILVTRFDVQNLSDTEIKNFSSAMNYSVKMLKSNKEKIQLFSINDFIASMQLLIQTKMEESKKNVSLYNSYANLYNKCSAVLNTALAERKEIIRKGQTCIEYFVAENISTADISSLEITGGNFAAANFELKQKMLKGFIMPVVPRSKSVLYIAFPNFDLNKVVKIFFTIGNYTEEMK